jgi:hypothetical protein
MTREGSTSPHSHFDVPRVFDHPGMLKFVFSTCQGVLKHPSASKTRSSTCQGDLFRLQSDGRLSKANVETSPAINSFNLLGEREGFLSRMGWAMPAVYK